MKLSKKLRKMLGDVGMNGWQPIFDEVEENIHTIISAVETCEEIGRISQQHGEVERSDRVAKAASERPTQYWGGRYAK